MKDDKQPAAKATRRANRTARLPGGKAAPVRTQKPEFTRAQQRERSRSIILSTARKLFAERGFDGVRIDEIAVQAGVQRQLLLYYFKSKEDLWRLVVTEVAEAFNAALHRNTQNSEGLEPREALRNSLIGSLEAFLEEPDFPRLLVKEGGTEGARIQWLVENFNYVDITYGNPDFKRYISTSLVRDVLFSVYLSMAALSPLMEASLSRASGRVQSGIHPMTQEAKDELLSILMRMILASEDPASPRRIE